MMRSPVGRPLRGWSGLLVWEYFCASDWLRNYVS